MSKAYSVERFQQDVALSSGWVVVQRESGKEDIIAAGPFRTSQEAEERCAQLREKGSKDA